MNLLLPILQLVAGLQEYPSFEQQTIDDQVAIGYGIAIGDVNGDGKPDIIASGRSTHNLKIYWNRTGE